MELENKKFILDIIIAVSVVISLGISIRSCRTSEKAEETAKEANKISNAALETSQYQFLQINRPYITLSPIKFDNGMYWKVTQQDNVVKVALKYKIKNVGNVAAKDIELPNKIGIDPKMKLKKDASVLYQKPRKVTLGPGESFTIEPILMMGYENEEIAKKKYVYLISDKSYGADFLLPLNYTNELDETQKYRTFMQNRIYKEKALIIKSEMINLKDISEQK